MSGMSGGSMLRTRRKDVNIKPNRKLDRKSSRGMLYENEELRLRTININAEVERGQSDIKKLKRENEQLRREVGALRGEYDRLERLLRDRHEQDNSDLEDSVSCCSDCESECCNIQNDANMANDPAADEIDYCRDNNDSGRLTVVPEEPRSPLAQSPAISLSCQCPVDSKTEDTKPESPIKEYFTAMVTLPLTAHIPDPRDTATVFPKTGLDILINNNYQTENFDEIENFPPPPPPIGFIFPDVPDSTPLVPNNLEQSNYALVPVLDIPESGENLVQCLKKMQNNSRNTSQENLAKDSFFMCKTKKVIQQLTTVQNNGKMMEPLCNCCNVVEDDNINKDNPSYITEKNIELDYDYPKPVIHSPASVEAYGDISQMTHTTTEVNSTVVMIERTQVPEKGKGKWSVFNRSQSAPCNGTNEPVYATVHKLPKKLKRLNIKNLENETKYNTSTNLDNENEKANVNPTSYDSKENEKPANTCNGNDSELSEKISVSCESNVIPKTAIVRKKKRFTIHFKRKNKTKSEKETKKQTKAEPIPQEIEKDSDPTSEQSPETPDVSKLLPEDLYQPSKVKSKDVKQNGNVNTDHHHHLHHHHERTHGNCTAHKKRSHRNHDCVNRHGYSTFKHDSFQEMTTSHSERERTNSLSSSIHSRFSIPSNKIPPSSPNTKEGSIPWCGCWGNGCL